jgi:hypothetical protein
MRKLVFRFGIVLQVLFVLVVGLLVLQHITQKPKPGHWPGGFSQPTMALELPRSVSDVHATFQLLGQDGVRAQRQALTADSFGFIPTYWILISLMGWLLMQRRIPRATLAGACLIALITAAATFDYRENSGIAQMLNSYPNDPAHEVVEATRSSSLVKWTLTFAAIAVMSLLFLRRHDWVVAIGAYFLLVAGIGLVGTLYYNSAIEWAFGLTVLGLFLSGLTFCTKAFLSEF